MSQVVKKSTIFCDVDGTLFHYRKFKDYKSTYITPVQGTIDAINSAYNDGHHVILTTARPEYLRSHTMTELNDGNVMYHRLIMGIERGTRILINDNETPGNDRAFAINVTRNQDIDVDLGKYLS